MNAREIRLNAQRKAARLTPTSDDLKMINRLAKLLHNHEWQEKIRTRADVEAIAHLLPDDEFTWWVELGSSIAARLGHNRGKDPDTKESDHINEVADEFASRWIADAWTKITPNDPNLYELEQARKAAESMYEHGYYEVSEAMEENDGVFEAVDNVASEHYYRLGYKWIEHTVEPDNRLAWIDCETYATDLVEEEFKDLTTERPPTLPYNRIELDPGEIEYK